MVPTFTAFRSSGEAASFAPAASPRLRRSPSPWPPDRQDQSDPGVPAQVSGAHRNPAQIHRVRAGGGLEGLYTAGSSRPPSRLACRTHTVRQCRCVPSLSGLLSTRSSRLTGPDYPQLLPLRCDGAAARASHPHTDHSASWRTVSHLRPTQPRLVAHAVVSDLPTGVTKWRARSLVGGHRMRAAKIVRSARSKSGLRLWQHAFWVGPHS